MSKLFEKAHLYQTLEQRRNLVGGVFLNRYVYQEGIDPRLALEKAHAFVNAMDADEIDMWYAQFLLEDAINEFEGR